MQKTVFIIGRQRSGTTVLRELFMKYGAFNADEAFHGDITRPHRFYGYLARRVAEEPRLVNTAHHGWLFREYLQELHRLAEGSPVVIDLKYFALNAIPPEGPFTGQVPYLVRFMEETRPPVFHIIRRNKLRMHISEEMARKTGKWSARHAGDMPPEKGRVTIDPVQTVLRIRTMIEDDRAVKLMFANVPNRREFIYETMFRPDGSFAPFVTAGAGQVLERADLDATPSNMRMNPEPVSALVENHDALAESVRAAGYGWMLD
ncbi:hypothetical protein FDP22_05430 [Paroceanicella profunda]|uniref:Sulfotransferase n=1 Tax=Paroceanicella profunda TaxID=2579971 RepID=A0A5B8FXM6_9RHOB|nr:hypothetical protein [Paroceanicella profunda]QDL91272.1 hypothetical protein FDP22_05430 [Paroceanicella profunda]